jgi:hypothetical protein
MVSDGAMKGRLTGDLTGQADALGIKTWGQGQAGTFAFGDGRFQIHPLVQDPAATFMDHPGGGSDIGIGKTGDILLEEIHQAPFPLQGGQQGEA